MITIRHRFTNGVLLEVDADLRYANLSGADLSGANLSRANLRYANLSGADLSGADISGADLSGANLRGANLSGADMSGADISDANLSGADMSDADLRGADLRGADLSGIKEDFYSILNAAPNEVLALRLALVEGRVEGSTYEGKCACLVGTISTRPAEIWFMAISEGETPATNQVSAITVEWVDEWLAANGGGHGA